MLWHKCKINQVGPAEDHETYMMLTDTDGAFADRWFLAHPGHRKETLAVALTAISTGCCVRIGVDSIGELSVINRMHTVRD